MAGEVERICEHCFRPLKMDETICRKCGYNASTSKHAENALPPFTTLHGRYVIGHVIGVGGFGITYIANDTQTGERRAIKEFFPSETVSRDRSGSTNTVTLVGDRNTFSSGISSFQGEAQILSMLTKLPSTVTYYDFFYENGTAYFVMEFVDGVSLSEELKTCGGRMELSRALRYCTSAANDLDVIHSLGILHRDISPDNMLLKGKTVKLIDFGAASATFCPPKKNEKVVFLKKAYAAPEQYDVNAKQGAWTDVYELACTFYKLVSGQNVPDAISRKKGAQVTPLYMAISGFPKPISDAVEMGMELNARERFQSMKAFSIALNGREGGLNESGIPPQQNPYVCIVSGECVGSRMELENKKPIRVGRNRQMCDMATGSNPYISRVHCILTYYSRRRSVVLENQSEGGCRITAARAGSFQVNGNQLIMTDSTDIKLGGSDCIIRVVMK